MLKANAKSYWRSSSNLAGNGMGEIMTPEELKADIVGWKRGRAQLRAEIVEDIEAYANRLNPNAAFNSAVSHGLFLATKIIKGEEV